MARTRYKIYDPEAPHFLTATVVEWRSLFKYPFAASIVLDSMRHLSEEDEWTIHAYVLMEDHLHWIAQADQLGKTVRSFKSYTARRVIDALRRRHFSHELTHLKKAKSGHKQGQSYQLWQEGNQPKQLSSREMIRQKIDYIHENPVKRGYVERPWHWRYSSAGDYATGETGLVPIVADY